MSSEQPKVQNGGQAGEQVAVEPSPAQPAEPVEEPMSKQQEQTYNKMMSTLSKMNKKIEHAKTKLKEQHLNDKKSKTDAMTDKLIQSKESSQIITKENLLTDITESYEKVVIEVYSDNGRLKKKVDEMAKLIKEQSAKIYAHTKKEEELVKENEQLRAEVVRLKDERMMMARGMVGNGNGHPSPQGEKEAKKKPANGGTAVQNEDFDFWSMPQNDYGKKKKDFVQDSSLWVNQKEVHESVFMTEDQGAGKRKK